MAFNPKRLIPVVVIVALVAGGIWIDRQREAHRSSLSGVFEAQPTKVASRLGGRVRKILVHEGEYAHKGDLLVVCENEATGFEAQSAQDLARQAEAKRQLALKGSRSEEIQRQSAVVAELAANLKKLRAGSLPEEIGAARQRVTQAQARLDLAIRGPRRQDLAAAKAAQEEAEARLRQAQRGLTQEERAQLRARYEGARADASAARRDADREQRLFEEGASSKRSFEAAESRALQAEAAEKSALEGLQRAERGTPPEELAAAQHAADRARAQYDSLAAGTRPEDIVAMRAELEAAKDNLRLVLRGPRSEDIAAAKARLNQAESTLRELKNGTRHEDIVAAEAAARAATNTAASAKSTLEEGQIVSPIDGVVERVLVSDGDLVAPGQAVVQMNDPTDIWLRVYVPEAVLSKVKVNDAAMLEVDGLNEPLQGVVEAIATQGEFTPANLQTPEERGKQVFAVRIRLARPDARVKAGMGASVKSLGQWP